MFDPVFIDAETNGRHFKEMHVDGGTTLQVLAIPLKLAAAGRLAAEHRPLGQLYIIINNILEPAFHQPLGSGGVNPASRSFNTISKGSLMLYLQNMVSAVAKLPFS